MKKILVICLTLTVIFVGSYAYAKDLTGKVSVGIVAGGTFPADDDSDNTGYIGGNIAYSFNNYFALGAEIGYSSWEDEAYGLDYGDVRAVPLLADLYLRYPVEAGQQMLLPYGIFGLGPVFFDYDESSLLESYGISADIDTALGVKLGGGFDIFVGDNVAFNLEGSYLISDTELNVAAFGAQASAELDTDAWIINGGIKYYF